MTGKLVEQYNRDSLKTSEVHIQITERDGEQWLVIKEQRLDDRTKEYAVEIPASLLPELKRAVEEIVPNEAVADAPSVQGDAAQGAPDTHSAVAFAHDSEAEFARILDFYHINWQYEPRSFVLERDADGNVLKCFTPDFYLPDHDLFIEITTL